MPTFTQTYRFSKQMLSTARTYRQPGMTPWLLMLMSLLTTSLAQRAATWDACDCEWVAWEAWSICDKQCFGSQVKKRAVSVLTTPECGEFSSCDGGDGAYEFQTCNAFCTYGTKDPSANRCSCPEGRYGVCCTNVVTCGQPSVPTNADYTVSDGFDYGSDATYTCHSGYNMTGAGISTCKQNAWFIEIGYWSGSLPTCHFVESCKSSPCENGGTCVDGLDVYTCMCPQGWTGQNCETDIQPPVATDCTENSTLYTAEHHLNYEWKEPNFSDPLGNDVTTTSNYHNNSYMFPWGDFMVQYVATKPTNGLQTTCEFQLQVRPTPCQEFQPPKNGYVVCNGWKPDYGLFCLIGCLHNYTLPRDQDARQLFVCGSSGAWTPALTDIECEEDLSSSDDANPYKPVDCDDPLIIDVKENYISELKLSSFNSFCIDEPDLCYGNNVSIDCA